MKAVLETKVRLKSRRGSLTRRKSHSRPARYIQCGNWGTVPAKKAKAAPPALALGFRAFRG